MATTALQSFVAKRAHWVDLLRAQHGNSISSQLTVACRDAAFFEVVRQLGTRSPEEMRPNSRMLELFQLGYAYRQFIAIRRLVDRTKGANSLFHIVSKLKASRHLLTRLNMVTYDGTPFDIDATKAAYWATVAPDPAHADAGDPVLLARYLECERRHRALDQITIKGERGRNDPDDRVAPSLLGRLENALGAPPIRRVVAVVNHFVAHAIPNADPNSPEMTARYIDINESLREIARVYAFITGRIIGEGVMNLVPYPHGHHLRGISTPLVVPAQEANARDAWRASAEAIEAWISDPKPFDAFLAADLHSHGCC